MLSSTIVYKLVRQKTGAAGLYGQMVGYFLLMCNNIIIIMHTKITIYN